MPMLSPGFQASLLLAAARLSRDTAENQTWQISGTGREDRPGFVPV
ncbi:MAG: hypothetical protein GY862_11330 [Gammaproteobacteria bacterium]|nr:hypothetical protein [Gammaproteobacteria bacterium]